MAIWIFFLAYFLDLYFLIFNPFVGRYFFSFSLLLVWNFKKTLGHILFYCDQSQNPNSPRELPISQSGEDPPCQNGAAEYLWFAGIVLLVVNLLGFFGGIAQKCAEKVD